ncbi:hypothetical protein [Streptomyces ipomoeae]|uniref:hypothetical protein n=1 Tax=Streptomyces ipomoeae TaxID=103232 RepID=UPI0015F0845F|nr:hypothetical protein [Streptomyces ipomoeae]MDX2931285.1 hypothetical protein [Streptomyces ipomoeae]
MRRGGRRGVRRTDVVVRTITLAPGGSTGRHHHQGQALAVGRPAGCDVWGCGEYIPLISPGSPHFIVFAAAAG